MPCALLLSWLLAIVSILPLPRGGCSQLRMLPQHMLAPTARFAVGTLHGVPCGSQTLRVLPLVEKLCPDKRVCVDFLVPTSPFPSLKVAKPWLELHLRILDYPGIV